VIAGLAAQQGGRVARRQLLRHGVSRKAIEHRLRRRRLHRERPGVYAVGHRLATADGRRWSALLAYADDVWLGHFTAIEAWGLRDASPRRIDLVTRQTGRIALAGIALHRTRRLLPHETATLRGMPITSPARALLDLAATLSPRRIEQVIDRAEARRLVDLRDLHRVLDDHPHRAGTPRLRDVLAAYAPTITRSELEELFLELCDRHGIPRPSVNTRIDGIEVDMAWRRARLIVELDGYAHHRSPAAFEADRARDVALTVAGWRVLRFTYRQVVDDPERVALVILDLLRRVPP
jgi:hypothetical protein